MTNELVVTEQSSPYAIMPVMDVRGAAQRRQALIDYTAAMMVKGRDFGTIPGAGPKPTLLKPGAEKLASLFGLSPVFDVADREMDWTGANHDGEAFFYIQYRCTLYRGDSPVGQGLGSCNSWEKKYRFRSGVKNPNPADLVNTIDKMAQKRALVAAVLIAVNASEFFTQDVEDYSDIVDGDWQPAPAQAPAAPKKPAPPANNLRKVMDNAGKTIIDRDTLNNMPAVIEPWEVGGNPIEKEIATAAGREFVPLAAKLLEVTEDAIKERMRALGYEKIPGNPFDRVAAFRKVREYKPAELFPPEPPQGNGAYQE